MLTHMRIFVSHDHIQSTYFRVHKPRKTYASLTIFYGGKISVCVLRGILCREFPNAVQCYCLLVFNYTLRDTGSYKYMAVIKDRMVPVEQSVVQHGLSPDCTKAYLLLRQLDLPKLVKLRARVFAEIVTSGRSSRPIMKKSESLEGLSAEFVATNENCQTFLLNF
jgi:hypothetical protein